MLARKGDVDVFSFLSEGLNYCTRYNLRSNLSFLIGELLMIMKKIRNILYDSLSLKNFKLLWI